jgi:hypothetical protein
MCGSARTGNWTTAAALEAVCEQRGWQVVQVYADSGISGAKGENSDLADAGRMPGGRFNVHSGRWIARVRCWTCWTR